MVNCFIFPFCPSFLDTETLQCLAVAVWDHQTEQRPDVPGPGLLRAWPTSGHTWKVWMCLSTRALTVWLISQVFLTVTVPLTTTKVFRLIKYSLGSNYCTSDFHVDQMSHLAFICSPFCFCLVYFAQCVIIHLSNNGYCHFCLVGYLKQTLSCRSGKWLCSIPSFIFMSVVLRQETVEQLLSNIFDKEKNESAIVSVIQILLTLFETRRPA